MFHTRCWKAEERCTVEIPVLREIEPGHEVACHFPVEKVVGSVVGPMGPDVHPIPVDGEPAIPGQFVKEVAPAASEPASEPVGLDYTDPTHER